MFKKIDFKQFQKFWLVYFVLAVGIDIFATVRFGSLSGGLEVMYWIILSMFYVSGLFITFGSYKQNKSTFNLAFAFIAVFLMIRHMMRLIEAL